ncbi:signal recognition particle-docking protein FtsY, partial [Streptomyces hydrogenans]
MELILAVVIALVVAVAVTSGLVISGRKKKQLPPAEPPSTTPTITAPPAEPHVGDEAETPREEPRRTVEEVDLPTAEEAVETPAALEDPVVAEAPPAPEIEVPEPTAGRLVRLRARLARSQNSLGKGLLTLLSREHLDEDTWEEIEETL